MDTHTSQLGAAPSHVEGLETPRGSWKGWSFSCAVVFEDVEETTRMVQSGERKKKNWNYLILTTWLRETQDSSR